MDIFNNQVYNNNYARAAAYYLGTCSLRPKDYYKVQVYELITGIYSLIFEDSLKVGYKSTNDVYFAPWEQQKGREKDIKNIREPIARIEAIIKDLFDLTEGLIEENGFFILQENYTPSRALQKALQHQNIVIQDGRINITKEMFKGLKELAKISRENIIHITDGAKEDKAYLFFSRCVFDVKENWIAIAFDKFLNCDGRLIKLCGELERRGYKRIDCKDGKKITFDYVMSHGKKNEPVKITWANKTYSGIEVSYEELRLEPCFIWLRLPMFRFILENTDKLPANVLRFISNNTKDCDGCRYCVQTDKTHTRSLANIKVNNQMKCPYFIGFSMNWRKLDDDLYNNILATIDALKLLEF